MCSILEEDAAHDDKQLGLRLARDELTAQRVHARAQPGVQRLACGIAISRTEANHVSSGEFVFPIEAGIPGGIVLGYEVFARPRTIIAQSAAHDLFYLAVVKINAWSEFCHRLPRTNHYDASNSSTK